MPFNGLSIECPFELGDKVKLLDNGRTYEIDDIVLSYSFKTKRVNFLYKLKINGITINNVFSDDEFILI